METAKIIEILLVEDNPADVELTRISLNESRIINNLNVAEDGEKALNYLYKRGEYESAKKPDLIFLDLNLPKVDGREVLENIKADPDLKSIPVVVLTSSKNDEDITNSYNLYANCFVSKPLDLEQFITVVQKIEDFWFGIVRLPNEQ